MIISDAVFNKENGEWKHRFQVTGTTPTEASVKYDVKNSKEVTVGYKEQVIAVTKNGDYYSFSVSVPAEKYTVKLNTEPKLMEYESVENAIAKFTGDKPLNITANYSSMTFSLPFCDVNSIKIELFDSEGRKLDAVYSYPNGMMARNWWKQGSREFGITFENSEGNLSAILRMNRLRVIAKNIDTGIWEDVGISVSNYYRRIYLRVSGLKNLIKNDTIKIMTGAQESDCTGTYGGWIERE